MQRWSDPPAGTRPRTAGFVLAGGQSRRMGRNKCLLPHRDGTLVEHVAAEVQAAAGSVTIVGDAADSRLAAPALPDLYPGFGPVGGIVTALRAGAADWNLVVACDMPGIHRSFLRAVLDAAAGTQADCVIPKTADGRVHPLCAAYHVSAIDGLQRAVEEGVHKLRQALKLLDVRWLPTDDESALWNVNTPDEWSLFQEQRQRTRG